MLDGGENCLWAGVPTEHAAKLQVKEETSVDLRDGEEDVRRGTGVGT